MIQILNTEHTSQWRGRERVGCCKGNRRGEGNGIGGGRGREREGGERGEGREEKGEGGRRGSKKKLSLFFSKF